MWKHVVSGAVLVLLVSCAPKRIESPLEKAPPAQIEQARELARDGDPRGARNAYEKFIIEHPGTTEADLARLELGLLSADAGHCENAVRHLEQAQDSADRAIALRASLHLGACQLSLGDPDRALTTVEPLTAERFGEEEQDLLWDTVIVAGEQTASGELGLRVIDALFGRGTTPPDPQRAWATTVLLAQRVTIEEAETLRAELRSGGGPQVAVTMRLLEHALEVQDPESIARYADALRATDAMAMPEVTILVARADEFLHGNPFAVGALLPLSGRGREVGRQLLEGMQLAQLDEGGPELVVEDTGGDPGKTEAAIARLIGNGGVIAVLGPVGTQTTEAAARAARHSGVPLISFAVAESVTDAGGQVFRMTYSPRDEIQALVRDARSRGLSRFVALFPDHGYGRTMERLFDQEVATAGGVACEGVAYPPGTKSFVDYVRTVLETSCEVVLLADVADQVALVAPTFAAEGAWSLDGGALPEHAEREVHFLLPSPSWSSSLIARAHRYLQGARIVLPFYEGSQTAAGERFRVAYETRYGRAPQTFAAYGYDAYRIVSAALRQGHQTRGALADALKGSIGVDSVTSVGAFSLERVPASPPGLYRVVGTTLVLEE